MQRSDRGEVTIELDSLVVIVLDFGQSGGVCTLATAANTGGSEIGGQTVGSENEHTARDNDQGPDLEGYNTLSLLRVDVAENL